jgi:quercetin dioxygenase-like cupin family protein
MVSKNPVVDSNKFECGEVWGETDPAVHWADAFAVYGGHGATASSTIVYEVEPGKRLGWHTDATEETQYIIAGTGKLYLEDGSTWPVVPGSVFVLPTPTRHDLENTGKETLRAVAFFAAAMFTQNFDQRCCRRRATSSARLTATADLSTWRANGRTLCAARPSPFPAGRVRLWTASCRRD